MSHPSSRSAALTAFTLALAALLGCSRGKAPPPQMPPPKVTVARPVLYPVQEYYQYNGYLEAMETVQIRARVQGFLKEINFTEGDEVRAGRELYVIDPREYTAGVKKAEADRLRADAELNKAKADEARAKLTLNEGATSKEDYQQKVASRETAEAVIKQTDASLEMAKLTLSFATIVSPIDGRISRTLVTRGNLVGQGESTLLTTIVSLDPLYVYFDVPERDLVEYQHSLREKALPSPISQDIPVEVGVATEEGFPHGGKIDFRENRVETATGTVRIRGRIPNPALTPGYLERIGPGLRAVVGSAAGGPTIRLLYPGLFARVRVPSGLPADKPVLPEDALMSGQEGRYVYVVAADNKVVKKTVTVGPQVFRITPPGENRPPGWLLVSPADGHPATPVRSVVAIEKGLGLDDVVIVNGLQRARPGSEVAPETWDLRAPRK
jgi:RND family efflux transporter MFP subunit